jgi:hypothetical protein
LQLQAEKKERQKAMRCDDLRPTAATTTTTNNTSKRRERESEGERRDDGRAQGISFLGTGSRAVSFSH